MGWCNVGFAELVEYKKCFPIMEDGIEAPEIFNSWDKWNKEQGTYLDYGLINIAKKEIDEDGWQKVEYKLLYEGPLYDDYIFSINVETGLVTELSILNDQWLAADYKYQEKFYRDKPKEFADAYKNVHGKTFPSFREKFVRKIYEPINYAGDILEAKYVYIDKGRLVWTESLNLNLKSNEIHTRFKFAWENSWVRIKKLQCNKESSGSNELGISSGTAFFINYQGNLLTNNHVVDGCIQSKINYFDKEYDAQLIATDKNLDLALLKVDLEPKSYLSFSANIPKKLQKIYVAGYPFGKGLSDDLKISSGIVSSLKGLEDNSNELQVDAPINYGNSGGPIVGEKGELVAIAVSGLAKEITEGINFGIKSSAVENFLSVNEIQPSISKNNSINNDQLLKILEGSTVYTYCELKK